MPGFRKRRGVTLVELCLVIAILAMIALPFAAFVAQNLSNTVQSSTQLKEQLVLQQVMQDMEKNLRSAVSMNGATPCAITISTNGITFTSRTPTRLPTSQLTVMQYTYVLAGGLLKRNNVTFPEGLETGMITDVTFESNVANSAALSHYVTILLAAGNTTLQKTIYLRNY
jgi:prepilin-type N-terminal cleavage/methylation domain-containing protein